jgi:hypothetical protein
MVLMQVQRVIKSYVLHVLTITLSAIVLNPLQMLFLLVVIFVEVQFLHKMLKFFRRNPVGFELLYLVLSVISYYICYGSISLSALVEESRMPILGAQLIDYSYWNLLLISLFLMAKLILVEMIMLLPLLQMGYRQSNITPFVKVLSSTLVVAISVLVVLIWWQYMPGNQNNLSILATDLLFIGTRLVVFSLSILLISLVFTRVKNVYSRSYGMNYSTAVK